MKKLIFPVFLILMFSGCGAVSVQNDPGLVPTLPANSIEIDYKASMVPGTYEGDKVAFDLYYESELGTYEVAPAAIEIYEKGSPASEDLAGGDILVQVSLNQDATAYDDLLDYYAQQSGNKAIVYEFPEAYSELRTERHVDMVNYNDGSTTVYMLYWLDRGKSDFIQITQNTEGAKRWNQIMAILNSIELNKAVEAVSTDVPTQSGDEVWNTYESKEYSVSYPSDFVVTNVGAINLSNYDVEALERDERGIPIGVLIQIQTHLFRKEANSYEEELALWSDYGPEYLDDLKGDVVPFSLNSITHSQYISGGPGGAFQSYFVPGKDRTFYVILAFEDGYSKNVDLVESILKTFKVL